MLSVGGLRANYAQLKALLGDDTLSTLFKKLRITYTPKIGKEQIVKLYSFSAGNIHLPRSLLPMVQKLLPVVISFPPIRPVPCQLQVNLFENQVLAVDAICAALTGSNTPGSSEHGTCVLNMKAGTGKTFVAAGAIYKMKLRTLYIVPKIPLAAQTVKDLRLCFGVSNVDTVVNKFGPAYTSDHVTVIVINSALMQPASFFETYDLVILDEIHMYCSDKRRQIFKQASVRYMIGMSATTNDRKDGFDVYYYRELVANGRTDGIIQTESLPGWYKDDVQFDALVDICYYNGPSEYTKTLTHETTGEIFTPYMHKQSIQDKHRVAFAVSEIRKLYTEGHDIYVFAEEISMLEHLATFLDADTFGKFTGGLKESEIMATANKRILLTTYGYASTGVSIEKQTAILFLTPRRSNMKQILARVLRRSGDVTVTRRIIDIVDNKTPMRYQLKDRIIAYNFYNMRTQSRKIVWSEI